MRKKKQPPASPRTEIFVEDFTTIDKLKYEHINKKTGHPCIWVNNDQRTEDVCE